MKAWTTKPPPKESVANRAERRSTVGRERPSGRRSGAFTGASTAGVSVAATTAPASATGHEHQEGPLVGERARQDVAQRSQTPGGQRPERSAAVATAL